ncbi:MAG: FAD-binding oxidoreductase, partial [Acidimicrobiales bacterium]
MLVDDDVRAPYERDWTGRFSGRCLAVVRPRDTGQVAAVLELCSRQNIAVVPQGGNTGLVGGSVPRPRSDGFSATVVLSLLRLDQVEPPDEHTGVLRAGAGATLASAQEAAAPAGYELGIDLSARGSATLGGMAATNAGGMHVL